MMIKSNEKTSIKIYMSKGLKKKIAMVMIDYDSNFSEVCVELIKIGLNHMDEFDI